MSEKKQNAFGPKMLPKAFCFFICCFVNFGFYALKYTEKPDFLEKSGFCSAQIYTVCRISMQKNRKFFLFSRTLTPHFLVNVFVAVCFVKIIAEL